MKILILGGDGFIGSHLLKHHIKQGDKCFVLDINNIRTSQNNNSYTFIKHDITEGGLEGYIKYIDPDLVYNCVAVATPSFYVKYPLKTFKLDFEVNHYNICKPLLEHNIPFVHFSTSEVYGKKWNSKYKENETNLILGPTSKSRWIYATSKILLEQLLLGSKKQNFVIIRPQNFCGWDMDWLPDLQNNCDKTWIPRLPACFLNALVFKQPLKVVMPGSQKRCYTHIDDAIQGIYSIVQNWDICTKDPIFNVGNPKNEIDILSLAKLYKKIWKQNTGVKASKIEFVKGEDLYGKGYEDSERRFFSSKKIFKATGWKAQKNIKNTINDIVLSAIEGYNIKI